MHFRHTHAQGVEHLKGKMHSFVSTNSFQNGGNAADAAVAAALCLGVVLKIGTGTCVSHQYSCTHAHTSHTSQDGGNAVDAAVAAALCLGVVSPYSSGVGGGLMMVIRSAANGSVEVINAREPAPASATRDMYKGGYVHVIFWLKHIVQRRWVCARHFIGWSTLCGRGGFVHATFLVEAHCAAKVG
jgi:hypothetical protein